MSYGQAVKTTKTSLEEQVVYLENELGAREQMIAFILKTIGEPVFVSKESLEAGIEEELGIIVEENLEEGGFTFSLKKAPEIE